MIDILKIAVIPAVLTVLVFISALLKAKRKLAKDLWIKRLQSVKKHDENVDLTIVIPAYNEEKRLPSMLDETIAFLEQRCKNNVQTPHPYRISQFNYEIIVVDDGSKDKTSKCARLYQDKYGCDKIKVLTITQNRGKGGAVRVGVLSARGSYILFADADGASKFSDIYKLEKFMLENKDHSLVLAIGSRAHMEVEAMAKRSIFRTILMKGFHLLVLACVRTVRDTQCGFKMFNRKAAELLFTNYHNESWAFDVELLYLAEQLKCKIGEISIKWTEIEGSKIVPILSWIRMGYDVLCIASLYTLGIYKVPRIDKVTFNQKKTK